MAETSKLSTEDRLDIMELFAKYSWGIDLADADMAVSCFAEDGYFDHLWQGRVQGHPAILKNLQELWYDRQHWWFGRQHLFNHFLMTPEKTPEGELGARVKSFFQIIQFNVDYGTNFVFGIGTRNDLCVKRGGAWLFKHLYVNAWISRDTVPWRGEIKIAARPGQMPPPMPNPSGSPPELTRELSGTGA
jgi:SnoaL-like domain